MLPKEPLAAHVDRAIIVDRIALALCAGAILFLIYGALLRPRPNTIQAASPAAVDSRAPILSGTGFAKDAVEALPPLSNDINGSPFNDVRGPLSFYGSHIGNDSSTGSVTTCWYRAVPVFYIFVAGYLGRPGNRLMFEVKTTNAGIVRQQVAPFEDPGPRWLLKRIPLKQVQGAEAFRIVAVDGSTKQGEWVGFSQPFIDTRRSGALQAKQVSLVILTAAAAIVALLAPGLILRQKLFHRSGELISLIWVPLPGLIALALIGVAAWVVPLAIPHPLRWLSPALICRVGLCAVFLYASYQFFRYPLSTFTHTVERQALLVLLALITIAIGKSIYSQGPVGELFHDEISRTLEAGNRSDSRQPYFVVQLIGTRSTPFGPFSRELYETWSFSDRGPIAGLASTPIVLSGPVSILDHKPEEPWTIFDHRGFAAYRIAMIVMAASTLLFVFGLSKLFLSDEWALLASLVTMGSPFVIHDIYYTWPKLVAAGLVLLAAYLVLQRRPFLAGLALGFGYLCHPSALLFGPAIVAVIVVSGKSSDRAPEFAIPRILRWTLDTAGMLTGVGIFLVIWRVINTGHYTQNRFLDFFYLTDGVPGKSMSEWLKFRLDSVLNTLVPLNLVLFHAADPGMNAIEGPSPPVVHFFMQPWCALPFGAGLAYFFCLLRLLYLALLKARQWLILVFCFPFLIFAAYMGFDSTGLLRDGLHAWFLGLMIFSVVIWSKFAAQSPLFWKLCNWTLLIRGLETLSMMLVPTLWTRHELVQPPFIGTDLLAILTIVAATAWLYLFTFFKAEELRKRSYGARSTETVANSASHPPFSSARASSSCLPGAM